MPSRRRWHQVAVVQDTADLCLQPTTNFSACLQQLCNSLPQEGLALLSMDVANATLSREKRSSQWTLAISFQFSGEIVVIT